MTEVKLLGSRVVCAECENPVHQCVGCGKYACHECGDGFHSEETTCNACFAEEADRYAWMGRVVAREVQARRALDLPSSATDAEVMTAARGLK